MPTEVHPDLHNVIEDHKLLFSQHLGKTTITTHTIDTGDAAPVKVPPRPIPFHYAERVQTNYKRWQEMALYVQVTASGIPLQFTFPRAMENFVSVWTLFS